MNYYNRPFLAWILLLLCSLGFAETSQETLSKARQLYLDESWEKSFTLVSEAISESSPETSAKVAASELLTGLATQEYDAKNFKNAYDGVRKALKYDPSNAKATQLFLKIRKLGDSSKLSNEGAARVKAPVTLEASKTNAGSATVVPVVVPDETRLLELKAALEQSGERLKALESNVASTSQENETLRAQAEKQSTLLQSFLESQATSRTSAVANTAQSARERELTAQTLALLAKISEREATPAPVVVTAPPATDPAVLEALKRVEAIQAQAPSDNSNLLLLILVVTAFFFFVLVGLVIFLIVVGRRRAIHRRQTAFDPTPNFVSGTIKHTPPIGRGNPEPRLLEFMSPRAPGSSPIEDFDIRRDLMKADRLKRMYEEVKQGTLNWSTVKEYIGELDLALKTEILKVVENKLEEGELVSSEAVLPVLFPFLTDYDDFVRQKAESLAKSALTTQNKQTGYIGNQKLLAQEETELLGIRSLMEIPNQLSKTLKTHDQTLMTAKICRGIGTVLNLSTEENNLLYRTALAHDCGYLMLDQDNLQRIIGKQEISEEDFEFIKSHTIKGPLYFGDSPLPQAFLEGLLHHHERNDGTGYPDGIKKDEIHQFAKIIGVAETFAALISNRTYREKRDMQHALAIITDGARTKFDPDIVDALRKIAPTLGRI